MKRFICILLILALVGFALSGCDRRSPASETSEDTEGSFAPETTAVGGLTQAVEDQGSTDEQPESAEAPVDESANAEGESADIESIDEQEAVQDQPVDQQSANEGDDPEAEVMPFASPTPQPNIAVSQYTEISAPGLGFRFSYPTNWVNIPGRSTVCYVQPLENGTVYPARVAVTMKRMPHSTNMEEVQTELVEYFKVLQSQYDNSTFKIDTQNVDVSTKFMGKNSISTTYLAYDGSQEIKGYVIATYFERYIYVFHFLCAYNDYSSFEATLRYMRDSVQTDASVAPK